MRITNLQTMESSATINKRMKIIAGSARGSFRVSISVFHPINCRKIGNQAKPSFGWLENKRRACQLSLKISIIIIIIINSMAFSAWSISARYFHMEEEQQERNTAVRGFGGRRRRRRRRRKPD